jgi:superfamily II DNA or RNA helicase
MLGIFSEKTERKSLRPHQELALELLRKAIKPKEGIRRVVLQGPVGMGKTLVAAKIIEGAMAKGHRAIFTAPQVSLIDQTVAAFEAEGIRNIGVMQANHPRTDPLAGVQVASVQTLSRREIPQAALVIVDEAHIRDRTVERLMADRPDAYFIGLTATPWAKGMGLLWQDLCIPCTVQSLIDDGFLSKFIVYAPDVPDLSRVKVERGDYAEGELSKLMGDAKLVGNVVETWLAKGEGRPTLAFGVDRAHASKLHSEFERAGVASAYVDGMVDRIARQRIANKFRSGEVRVVCSVRTMTTGVDLPVSCIIDAAPTQSEMLHVQKIGRGLRVNPGTEDLIVLDHAGNSLRLGLVSEIHHETLDTTKPGDKQKAKPKADALPKPCAGCGALFSGAMCPACGKERRAFCGALEADGELVEITGRKPKATAEDKQLFWSMALWLDRERCRGGKLAKGLYKGRFDVWPRGLTDVPVRADEAFLNYEKSRRIAYAKRMAGKAA